MKQSKVSKQTKRFGLSIIPAQSTRTKAMASSSVSVNLRHVGHVEGKQPYLGDLPTMVINHLPTGMILEVGCMVYPSLHCYSRYFQKGTQNAYSVGPVTLNNILFVSFVVAQIQPSSLNKLNNEELSDSLQTSDACIV